LIAENGGFSMFLNQHVQSHHVFDYMLDRMKGADSMTISSFAITEAYVRRIIRNRWRIGRIDLVLDFTIASRNRTVLLYAAHNVDGIYLVNNHSKIILVEKDARRLVAVMSNNATNNHRYESGVIFDDPEATASFAVEIEKMKKDAKMYG